MKLIRYILVFFLFLSVNSNIQAQEEDIFKTFPESQAKYIEDDIPDINPKPFLVKLTDFSKHHIHSSPIFSPEGNEMFFSIYINYKHPQRVFHTYKRNGRWIKPQELHFSNEYQTGGPVFSSDGKRVYFYSKKPINGDSAYKNAIIWYTEKQKTQWSELKPILYDYDTTKIYVPNYITKNNELYFTSGINGKSFSIYKGKITGNRLSEVKKLNSNVNKEGFNNGMAVLNNDENAIIYWRFSNGDQFRSELFIAYKNNKGDFGQAKSMGENINKGGARFAGFSHDGKYFFFLSSREEFEKMYWVDSKIIEKLKHK